MELNRQAKKRNCLEQPRIEKEKTRLEQHWNRNESRGNAPRRAGNAQIRNASEKQGKAVNWKSKAKKSTGTELNRPATKRIGFEQIRPDEPRNSHVLMRQAKD